MIINSYHYKFLLFYFILIKQLCLVDLIELNHN